MYTSAVSASSYSNLCDQSTFQKLQQEFQQLGNDLQSGDLTAAQSDFVTLQQDIPQSVTDYISQSTDPIAQAFNQLTQDLQAGDLTAAQQDYATIQQDAQNPPANIPQAPPADSAPSTTTDSTETTATDGSQPTQQGSETSGVHHHHHFHGWSSISSTSETKHSGEIKQLMTQLGQELQSGDLTSAQQTYASLQKDFQQFRHHGGEQSQTSSDTTATTVSVSA